MCNHEIPDERLRVFISSAQSNEGGFAWLNVRRKIKDYLKECPYLNPFIIEEGASPVKSGQYYQIQLLRADIVVLLVKGEVRNGTATEYALAKKHKKPMLIYFLDDEQIKELSAIRLKKDVQDNDYCTYCSLTNFDDVEKRVRKDVIESVIRYFQYSQLNSGYSEEDITDTTSVSNDTQDFKHSIPTKTAIGLFSSCYAHIFNLLDISQAKSEDSSEPSPLHDFGIAALDWLVTGTGSISDKDILKLIDHVSDMYSDTTWLSRRWDAIRHEFVGDIDGALTAENQALLSARASGMPPWIIANILIDCRNIENEIFARDGSVFYEGEGQKGLNELDTIVYLPVLDRYLGDVYGGLAKETEKLKMVKPGTIFMGTNIVGIINDIENYFFTAILYGSYTHMIIARELLAKILYQYAELTGKESLLFDCVKLLVLHGNATTFKKMIEHKWDDVYLSVASGADNLWRLTDHVSSSSRTRIKLAVFTKLGMYMTDDCFAEAEKYLKYIDESICLGDREEFFDCICQNINRLNAIMITEMLTDIIREQRFVLARKLANILLYLDLTNVPQDFQRALCKSLQDKITLIVSNGGHPQFITSLIMQNKEIFEVLASVPDNGLHGTAKIFHDINMGSGDWNKVILDQINTAKQQFDANKNPGLYHGFVERPYATIKNVIREHYVSQMAEIINEEFIPLCVDVLNSQAPADLKEECIDCLCDVIVYSNSGDIVLTQELKDSITKIDISETRTFMGGSKNILSCRVLMLRIVSEVADKEEMLEWCFEFAKKDSSTKLALAECVEQYLRFYSTDSTKIDAMILSIVFQCFEDEYWPVRRAACNSLAKMLGTRYKDRVERKLYEGAIDPSHYVRNHLLRMCMNGEIQDASISDRIKDMMKCDANFAIRTYANS